MSHQICPPCREAADKAKAAGKPVVHDPAICRDHAIQPHGCACQHGQRAATEGNEEQ